MRFPAWLATVPAGILLLAGCITDVASPVLEETDAGDPIGAQDPFSLSGAECVEAGFVAAYNSWNGMPKLAGVWQTSDIREEIGNPLRDSVGTPVVGPLFGNWHMGFRCKSVASTGGEATDYVFGYIGEMVEAPAWDEGGADLHFLMSGFGFMEGAIAEDLRSKTTAGITPALTSFIDWYVPKEAPRSAAYVVYEDAEKGLYESWSTLAFLRDTPERTIRLWWQVPVDGSMGHGGHDHGDGAAAPKGPWHPVYWDLEVSTAAQYTTPSQDGVEWAAHNKFDDEHFPAIFGQPTLTNIYEYETLTLTSGRIYEDVTLQDIWMH